MFEKHWHTLYSGEQPIGAAAAAAAIMNAPYHTASASACYTDIKQGILAYSMRPVDVPELVPPNLLASTIVVDKATNGKKKRRAYVNESEEARARRLARNAERMRQKRSTESEDEYRARLAKNAESNRRKRQNESDLERKLRHARSAARERLRRAMETPEQRAIRLAKLAERMRHSRANETADQRALRLAKNAAKAKERLLNETPEQWIERKRKKAEYARRKRSGELLPNEATSPSDDMCPESMSPIEQLAFQHQQQQHHVYHPLAQSAHEQAPPHLDKNAAKLLPQLKQEPLYPPPQIPTFNGLDIKPSDFLDNGQHSVAIMQGQPLDAAVATAAGACPSNLYKFHILPYSFPPGAPGQPQPADYKNK